VHPEKWFRQKTRIGGTKNVHIGKIRDLNPDLIIANKEENVKEQIEELSNNFPVWISDVNTLDDAVQMIDSIGEITGKKEGAETLITQIVTNFSNLQLQNTNSKLQTAYLIWKDPYMTIGGDTFIHDMLTRAGFENMFASKNRYPEITISQLRKNNCQLLLLSSEPYPFKQKDISELQEQLPQTKIILVDGEIFSWYGSRLLKAPLYFASLHQQIASMA
jgi:ABC-type Fe3+-hydroxamate transport system substrate-binding protein